MVTPENRARLDALLKKITDYLRVLPRAKLVTEPREFYPLFGSILTKEELLFLASQGDAMSIDDRNNLMKEVFRRSGRYIIKEYKAEFKGGLHDTFQLFIAEQA